MFVFAIQYYYSKLSSKKCCLLAYTIVIYMKYVICQRAANKQTTLYQNMCFFF